MNALFTVTTQPLNLTEHVKDAEFAARVNIIRTTLGKQEWGTNARYDEVWDYYTNAVSSPRPTKLRFNEKRSRLLHRRSVSARFAVQSERISALILDDE